MERDLVKERVANTLHTKKKKKSPIPVMSHHPFRD